MLVGQSRFARIPRRRQVGRSSLLSPAWASCMWGGCRIRGIGNRGGRGDERFHCWVEILCWLQLCIWWSLVEIRIIASPLPRWIVRIVSQAARSWSALHKVVWNISSIFNSHRCDRCHQVQGRMMGHRIVIPLWSIVSETPGFGGSQGDLEL